LTSIAPGIQELPVGLLDPNPDNPRRSVGDVTELADSIRSQGIKQNLLVVPHDVTHGGHVEHRYRVVIGHRRLAAAKQAGLRTVPCKVEALTHREELEIMLVENTQREQLTVLEEADAIQGLLQLGATVPQVADQLGRSQTYVSERRRIARIGDKVRGSRGDFAQLSFSELQAIAEFDGDVEAQEELAGASGTGEFAWTLDRLRGRRERRRWAAEARDAIGGLGLQTMPVDVERYWMPPDGFELEQTFNGVEQSFRDQWHKYAMDHDTDDVFVHVFDDDGMVAVYRTAPVDADATVEARRERQRREREAQAEREQPYRELDERSRRLREQWIGSTMFQLNLDTLTDLIVDLAGLLLLGAHPSPSLCDGLGCDLRDQCIRSYNRIRANHPLPVTDKDPKHNVWHLDCDENLLELDHRTTESLAEQAILTCAAIEARITWHDWTKPTPMMREYYRALQDAGYPTSEQERSALADGKEATR